MLKLNSWKAIANLSNRIALLSAALMIAASVAAIVARPTAKLSDLKQAISLEDMVPKQLGDWREDSLGTLQVVNSQQQDLLDRLYRQILSRTYVNAGGYRFMLSLAYGDDQRERGTLQAHQPEVCYPAQGFVIQSNEAGLLATAAGDIAVRRLFATIAARPEPLTYWFTNSIRGPVRSQSLERTRRLVKT